MSDNANLTNRRIILILGMHRSGTSCIARMLHNAGISLGGPLLTAPTPDNLDGYWEHAQVTSIENRLLGTLAPRVNTTDSPPDFPADWLTRPETIKARDELLAIARRETTAHSIWAVKDPRMMRFLPLWQDIARTLGVGLTTLLCLRNPDEVAASLSARNGHSRGWSHRIWIASHRDMLRDLPNGPDAVVPYDAVLADPTETLAHLSDSLSLGLSRQTIAAAILHIRQDHRHHTLPLPRDSEGLAAAAFYRRLENCAAPRAPLATPALRYPPSPRFTDTRMPDFLGIGGQRCGTTWLYRALTQHPEIGIPPMKEIHYFDQIHGPDHQLGARIRLRQLCRGIEQRRSALESGDEDGHARRWLRQAAMLADSLDADDHWYGRIFASLPPWKKVGEITPAYAILPEDGIAHIHRLMPSVRLFFSMRNPVERTISGAMHQLTNGQENIILPSTERLLATMEQEKCRLRSSYHMTIERWERYFPAEQISYIFFDHIKQQPEHVLSDLCRHLGVGFPKNGFQDLAEPVNSSPVLPPDVYGRLLDHARFLCRDELAWLADRFPQSPATAWSA